MPRSRDVLGGERDRLYVFPAQQCAFAAKSRERFIPEYTARDRLGRPMAVSVVASLPAPLGTSWDFQQF